VTNGPVSPVRSARLRGARRTRRDLGHLDKAKGPLSSSAHGCLTAGMFVGDEVLLPVSFPVARARLADLTGDALLRSASEGAYGAGIADMTRVGALGLSKVVRVHLRQLTEAGGQVRLAIRWEASGPAGGLFPALDADITLLPAEDQTTLLGLTGVYRPPLGQLGAALDRAALHRVAAATVRNFLDRLAASISAGAAEAGTGALPVSHTGDAPPPGA